MVKGIGETMRRAVACAALALGALGWVGAADAMTYRDNSVTFSLAGSGYSLVNGSYTVDTFSVTSGQDPQGRIHQGLQASMNGGGGMTFSVGRKGSEGVANWFNAQVPASQTTFGHGAGKLNFAFLGTLRMKLTGGILGGGAETFTFGKVALAQGHSGASNNWWFGGRNCVNIDSNRVSCEGVDSKGSAVSFVFWRGGNDVSTVGVAPSTLVATTKWMSSFAESVRLDQLMMPGSHDAGMSETHHCTIPFSSGYVQTQGESVGGQLVSGSRYFDVRVDYDHGELVTYHRTNSGIGCNGQDLQAVLDETVAFLQTHSSETAIIKISHIRSDRNDQANIKRRINELLSARYAGTMYTNGNGAINLSELTLGDVRGKMIVVYDYADYVDTATGRFRYKDGFHCEGGAGYGCNDGTHLVCSTQSGANLTVCDDYSSTAKYADMASDQLAKWSIAARLGEGRMFLLSWTLTANNPPFDPTIRQLADQANSRLPGVLHEQIVVNGAQKPNIVYIDYVNSATAQSIIRYNF